ncbi:Permease of the drug/metabolite transporter (DMT) superfamily [Filomicrobium insigne]|uniref:Permease of the drug/metabolite transporter (DMT) superfamily n=1 Tax=Filomicrobium insigne TaxID=418854 RepID=A0A1H0MNV8_9HYPH|nr:DMT family transporter [Filomicrobium insigne]SDO81985.1 Permease of the drug/metabolite transporter (DMT) superfamily [Filomicrobium insigne]
MVTSQMLMRVAPLVFVVLWSTGFIGSRLGAPDAEPFTFLSLRFLLVLGLLLPVALFFQQRAGGWHERGHAIVVGALIHGFYLGGVFWAIHREMPAGVAALIVSLQPIMTSVLAGPLLGERVSAQNWFGLAIGLVGAILILAPKFDLATSAGTGINGYTILASVIALCAITMGTLYQKRFATRIDLLVGAVWQYIGALIIVSAGALLFETREVNWTPNFIFALAWLVLVLSIGAISLLMLLIRQNAVATVAGLFYLVPGVTALIAHFMFGETLDLMQIFGLVLATFAVLLTTLRKENLRFLQRRHPAPPAP